MHFGWPLVARILLTVIVVVNGSQDKKEILIDKIISTHFHRAFTCHYVLRHTENSAHVANTYMHICSINKMMIFVDGRVICGIVTDLHNRGLFVCSTIAIMCQHNYYSKVCDNNNKFKVIARCRPEKKKPKPQI